MRKTLLITIFNLTIVLPIGLQPANATSFVLETDRPDRHWLAAFKDARKIVVTDSIEQAMLQCPEQQYCELLIDNITLTGTIEVNRSKTRFTGIDGNSIRMSAAKNVQGFFFRIEHGVSEVIFSGLNIDGENREKKPDVFGIGTYDSNISHVLISDNRIANLHGSENAHAIAFYGTGATEASAINNIIIENNHISDMRTGSSESIAINGNVRQWEIRGNTIERVNNIAIDAIGGEGTAPVQTLADGRIAPGNMDAARLGFIENNTVSDMSTLDNPAYGNKVSWAAAIYIDGGHSIKVIGNTVSNAPWSLVVGSENCVTSSFVQMFDNRSSNAQFGDVLLGGYSKGGYRENPTINCDPHTSIDASEGHGYVSNLDIRNNTLQSTSTNNELFIGNTVLQHRIQRSTVEPPYVRLNE